MRAKPLSEEEILRLLNGRSPALLYARRGRQNKLLGIDPDRLSDAEMLALMTREPALIRRPTLVVDGEVIPQPSQEQLTEIARNLTPSAAADTPLHSVERGRG
jgi:arsenate reductase-like glutaredoxin family protein